MFDAQTESNGDDGALRKKKTKALPLAIRSSSSTSSQMLGCEKKKKKNNLRWLSSLVLGAVT